jgi:ketosteroid isomerase-like protein
MNNNSEIVKRFYACLLEGDTAGVGALLSGDVILHVPGQHQLAGDYLGPGGVVRFAESSRSVATGERLELIDVLAGEKFVAALCRVRAQRPGAASLDNSTLHLAKVESGRIAEIWFHNFDQHAVDAFWGTRQ